MYLSFLFCLCVTVLGAQDRPNINDMPIEPGKCYAKCITSNVYEIVKGKFPRYTGSAASIEGNPNLERYEVIIAEATTRWEKRKADRNCLSSNPDDCLVWCLMEVPRETKFEYIVVDTRLTKDYEMVEMSVNMIVKKGGEQEWTEVLCENEITKKLIKKTQKKLIAHKLYVGEMSGILDENTKNALAQFQKTNGLNVGGITIETLKELGVK
jgi:peptidoglycan hydrolase-like protein with peptidoglycan-binding domain